jgi:AmpE protein
MKFLVVLTVIIVATIWKQDLDRIDDRWFFKLRGVIDRQKADKQEAGKNDWFIVFLATYSVPLLLLALVLSLSAGVLFGLVTIVIHIFVLLMAFDRIHPGALARQFLTHWEQGDYEACYLYLEKQLGCVDLPAVDDLEALHSTFNKLYVYRCFERMFVTLFWYLVAGPLGVLFAYVSYQLRYEVLSDTETPELEPVDGIIRLLEWLPLRLLGLTLGLVGSFEGCISRLKRAGLGAEESTAQAVYEYSLCALGRPDQTEVSDPRSAFAADQDTSDDYRSHAAAEIESLQTLMQRSQFVWLTVFALVTVLGWQF